jgi:hypothetical protein
MSLMIYIYPYTYICRLKSREYCRKDPSRWPHGTSYPQKFALTSPTSDGRSVAIVRSRTQATEFSFKFIYVRQEAAMSNCVYRKPRWHWDVPCIDWGRAATAGSLSTAVWLGPTAQRLITLICRQSKSRLAYINTFKATPETAGPQHTWRVGRGDEDVLTASTRSKATSQTCKEEKGDEEGRMRQRTRKQKDFQLKISSITKKVNIS